MDIYAAEDAGDVTVYTYPGNAWDYLASTSLTQRTRWTPWTRTATPLTRAEHPVFGNTESGRDVRRALNLRWMSMT